MQIRRPSTATVRAAAISMAGIAASLMLAAVILPMMGQVFGATALVMCLVCPLAIGFPMAYKATLRGEALQAAHRALAEAHASLAVAHARLAERARTDRMTGMLNRESFFEAIRELRSTGRGGTLLIIDADHFKSVNDRFGHQAGDRALLKIAAAIRRGARRADMIGRVGGEEFAAFLPDAGRVDALRVAETIRNEVERIEFEPEGERVGLSVSVGCVVAERRMTLAELMRGADRCLYAAKNSGRNRVVIDVEAASAAAA